MHFFLDIVVPLCNPRNMAHIIKKMKNGRPYYYVRETARIDGKPRVVTQIENGNARVGGAKVDTDNLCHVC